MLINFGTSKKLFIVEKINSEIFLFVWRGIFLKSSGNGRNMVQGINHLLNSDVRWCFFSLFTVLALSDDKGMWRCFNFMTNFIMSLAWIAQKSIFSVKLPSLWYWLFLSLFMLSEVMRPIFPLLVNIFSSRFLQQLILKVALSVSEVTIL